MNKKRKLDAFTMAEMLVVIAIIGILYSLVMPNQSSAVSAAKSLEAKSMLNQVYAYQKNHFYTHSKYSASLDDIDFEQERLVSEGGGANYRISIIDASNSGFTAQAEAVTDFDGDGTFNVWTIDQNKNLQEVTKD